MKHLEGRPKVSRLLRVIIRCAPTRASLMSGRNPMHTGLDTAMGASVIQRPLTIFH
jgi:hypothetical protein